MSYGRDKLVLVGLRLRQCAVGAAQFSGAQVQFFHLHGMQVVVHDDREHQVAQRQRIVHQRPGHAIDRDVGLPADPALLGGQQHAQEGHFDQTDPDEGRPGTSEHQHRHGQDAEPHHGWRVDAPGLRRDVDHHAQGHRGDEVEQGGEQSVHTHPGQRHQRHQECTDAQNHLKIIGTR